MSDLSNDATPVADERQEAILEAKAFNEALEAEMAKQPKPVKPEPVAEVDDRQENILHAKAFAKPVAAKASAAKPTKKPKAVANVPLYSSKNIHVGATSLKFGYNIVTEEAAAKWLKFKAVRKATAEEVKTAYGK